MPSVLIKMTARSSMKSESVPRTNHLQTNSCSTSMNVVKSNYQHITKKKKTFPTPEGSRNPQKKDLSYFIFLIKSGQAMKSVSFAAGLCEGWTKQKKATFLLCGVKQNGLVEILLWTFELCKAVVALVAYSLWSFLSRFTWILKTLFLENCEPEP